MHDVIILGGGPAGLSAAIYLARANVRSLILDAGAPRHAAAEAMHSLLTHDGRSPKEFRALAHAQLAAYGDLVERRSTVVHAVRGERGHFTVDTADGSHDALRVLLAVGVVDELPAIPGVREAWAVSVHHCPWCWGFEGRGTKMGLVMEVPMSVHVAGVLARLASEVHGFWHPDEAPPPEVAAAFTKATLHHDRVVGLDLDGRKLRAVLLASGARVPLDALYVHPAQRQTPVVASLELALDETGSVVVDAMQQTSRPGIYAAGDLVTRRQHVVHALATGANAATGITFDLVTPHPR